jgi:PadR family transcriptional regulator, regulatory protein PadR
MSKTLAAASARPMILSLLLKGESYGYRILQDVTALSGGTIDWSEALLYPVLHRMEKEGVVRSRWKMSEEKRMRNYYALTDLGRRELDTEKERWLSIHGAFLRLWNPAEGSD